MDWEKAARDRGWADTGPGTEIRHPDIPRVYYTWRQCCIAEGIEVERIMRQIKRDAAKANPRSEECLVTNIGRNPSSRWPTTN